MPYLLDGTKIATRARRCTMTDADLDAFFEVLRNAFPGIIAYSIVRHEVRILSSPSLGGGGFRFAIPDPGWEPKWGPSEYVPEVIRLMNPPRKSIWVVGLPSLLERFDSVEWIEFVKSTGDDVEMPDVEMPPPIPDKFWYWQDLGEMQGYYPFGDDDKKEFVGRFFKILNKFLYTNCYDLVNLRTKQVDGTATGTFRWCGPDVARLCREEPDYYWHIFPDMELATWTGLRPVPRATSRGKTTSSIPPQTSARRAAGRS